MAGLAGNLLVGYVIYYLRRLKVFSLMTVMLSFSILAYAFTRNLTVVTSLSLVESFITVIVSILVYRLVTTLSPPDDRGAAFGVLKALSIGASIISPIIGGFLISNYTIFFLLPFILLVVASIVALRFEVGNVEKPSSPSIIIFLKTGFKKTILGITAFEILQFFEISLAGPFIVLFFTDSLKVKPEIFGLAASLQALIALPSSIIGGRLSDKLGYGKMIALASVIRGAFHTLIALLYNPIFSLILYGIAGVAAFASGSLRALESRLIDRKHIHEFWGFINFWG